MLFVLLSTVNALHSCSRGINDLDDVRGAMAALIEIREKQIKIDMTIGPVEESYALLNKLDLNYNDGGAERVDGLAYQWKNVLSQVLFTPECEMTVSRAESVTAKICRFKMSSIRSECIRLVAGYALPLKCTV